MIDMRCNIRQIYTERPIYNNGKTVLIPKGEFEKVKTQAYLDVLTKDFKSVAGISKSYYYYILARLRKLGLIDEAGRIAFKLVIPYEVESDYIKFENELLLSLNPFIYLVTHERGNHHAESVLVDLISELAGKKYKKGDMCSKLWETVKSTLMSDVLERPLLALEG